MNRHQVIGSIAVLLVGATAFVGGAGSDVADAVMKGDKAAVRRLLTQKADVNATQVDGATALHWAVYRDDLETVDLLLRAGAKVTAANREGTTPIFMASLLRESEDDRTADPGRCGCERARAERRDDRHVRGAQRQPRCHQDAGRGGRRHERQGSDTRHERPDVGGERGPPRGRQGPGGAWGRRQRQVRPARVFRATTWRRRSTSTRSRRPPSGAATRSRRAGPTRSS